MKSLIFFHGANVSGAEAQEWADAVFKRLWLSGAKMEFYNVDWRSDIGSDANYHQNASNSFVVASQLASMIAAIPGEKVVMAHSLGNMVVSSMIQDHGLAPSCYLMCNSAVPAEAYDTDLSLRVPQLVHPDWEEYPTNSWASSWHWLFRNDPNDDRRLLGWPGRFSNVAQYAVNFYSTGDEVLELLDDNDIGILTGITSGYVQYSWHHQELWKGRGIANVLGATTWSGWNIEKNIFGQNKISVEEAQDMLDEDFMTNTVFYCYPSSMNSTNISLLVRGAHLAMGIPALTPPTGRIMFGGVSMLDLMINVNANSGVGIERPNGWPARSRWGNRWLHSDMKDISYFFNYKFYDKAVEKGNLK
ncbi:MAG: alpha/beta fold hydrolase [Exiguobacterium sp.]|nr:alpha/beta fold hydrolase [Exiguobacterium sp.]